jgi:hypothetical protein
MVDSPEAEGFELSLCLTLRMTRRVGFGGLRSWPVPAVAAAGPRRTRRGSLQRLWLRARAYLRWLGDGRFVPNRYSAGGARRGLRTAPATTTGPMASEFVPIVTEAVPVTAVPHGSAPVIEVRLAGAVVRVASGVDDAAQLTAVLRAVRASASRT